jgi:RND family efflux transporter MFP subunit
MSANETDLATLRIDREARPMRSRTWIVALAGLAGVIVSLAALTLFCSKRVVEVEVATVRAAGSASGAVLNASGYVTARRKATVAAKITGRVSDVRVEEGMPVKEGQILALLDDSEWKAQLDVSQAEHSVATRSIAEAEFSLKEAEKNLGRARELRAQGFVTEQDLDRAETNVAVWRARLEVAREQAEAAARRVAQAQRNLDNCTVRAPFSGVAVSKDAQIGEIVSPVSAGGGFTRTGISTIVDMRSLDIEVDVNEAYIARVEPNQPVEATLDAYPDWRIPAHVITTIPTADRQKATVRVRIAFDRLDSRILPDMGAKVAFLERDADKAASSAPRVLVAKEALRGDGATTIVLVVKEGRIERRAVKAGAAIRSDVPILAGLSPGETVIVKGPTNLAAGQRVHVKQSQ